MAPDAKSLLSNNRSSSVIRSRKIESRCRRCRMMDFSNWIQRAVEFHKTLQRLAGTIKVQSVVAPPMSLEEVNNFAGKLRLSMPLQLRRFLTEASANCACTYWWRPPPRLVERL